MHAPVTIYVISGCPYCQKARKVLKQLRVPAKVINVGRNPQFAQKLNEMTGQATVPKIFIHDRFIGGLTELMDLVKSGKFYHLL